MINFLSRFLIQLYMGDLHSSVTGEFISNYIRIKIKAKSHFFPLRAQTNKLETVYCSRHALYSMLYIIPHTAVKCKYNTCK